MKAIIYAGIGLFSLAGTYGLVDYFTAKRNGIMDNLYKGPAPINELSLSKEAPPVVTVENIPAIKKGNTIFKPAASFLPGKMKPAKRKVRLNDFSRGRITEPLLTDLHETVEIKQVEAVKPEEAKILSSSIPGKAAETSPFPKADRKLSLALFSRAPLRVIKDEKKPGH